MSRINSGITPRVLDVYLGFAYRLIEDMYDHGYADRNIYGPGGFTPDDTPRAI